jgi:nitrogen regulatory protein P-II 1
MKKIEAIVRPSKVDEIKTALSTLGVHGMTLSEVSGFGRQRGYREVYRGSSRDVQFVPKVKIEIIVHDEGLEEVLSAIVNTARTGDVGDGKIFILPVADVVRVRTGERGDSAL